MLLLSGCSISGASGQAPTATPSPTTSSATPDPYYVAEAQKYVPTPFPTTGDIVADLEASGMVPGTDYKGQFDLAKERLCDPEITDTSPNFISLTELFNAQGPGLVRVAIAYGCPERLDSAWIHIDK